MNAERRQILERRFDGEPLTDDPREVLDDAESLAYLHRLRLLRQLAQAHDPAAAMPRRRSVVIPPRSRQRVVAALAALAASLVFVTAFALYRGRTDSGLAALSVAFDRPTAGAIVAQAATSNPRLPRPSLEVELYRWANQRSPHGPDAAGVVLPRVGSPQGRSASREILALELANSTPGAAFRIPRSVGSLATAAPGSIRKGGTSRRHRPIPSPKA